MRRCSRRRRHVRQLINVVQEIERNVNASDAASSAQCVDALPDGLVVTDTYFELVGIL